MAANYLKGLLFHVDSYEPLQTKVDSSFISLVTDEEAIELTLNMFKLLQSAQEYSNEVEEAERRMDLWSPLGYSTAFCKGEYRRAKIDRENNQRLLDKTKDRVLKQFSKIKERQATLKEGAFDGWLVHHKYKCLNGEGSASVFGEYVFLCDKEFNEKLAYPKDYYDAFSKILIAISKSDDISEMEENLQDEIF